MNRKIPLWTVLLLFWLFCIATVIFGWAVWNIEEGGNRFGKSTKTLVMSVAKFPTLVGATFTQLAQPNPLILADKYPDINGLKTEKKYVDHNYILISSFDKKAGQSTIKIIRLSDQKILHKWTPDINQIVKITQNPKEEKLTKTNIIFRHPLLATDGSMILEIPFRLLFKIDKNSHLLWYLKSTGNHSLEFDADSNIWAQTVIEKTKFLKDFNDDAIVEISPTGKILFEKSVSEILVKNGYRGLLLGTGTYQEDLVRLNDIQPALTSGTYWNKGDLLISLRNKSTVFLYRPSTNRVIWLKTGPWINQHDVNFIDTSRISIFGNDVTRNYKKVEKLIGDHNEVYIYDFKTDQVSTPYTEFLASAQVKTLNEGRSSVLPGGDVFIEETNKGRLLRGSGKTTIWEFVDRVDQHSIAALSWSRFITDDDFKKLKFINK